MPFFDKMKQKLTDYTRPEDEKGKDGKELVKAIIAGTDLSMVSPPYELHPHEIIYRKMIHLLERVAHVNTEGLHGSEAKESADLFSAGRLKSKIMRHHREFSPQITAAVRAQARLRPGRLGHIDEENSSNLIGELLMNLHAELKKAPVKFHEMTNPNDESLLALAAIQNMLLSVKTLSRVVLATDHEGRDDVETPFSERDYLRVVNFGGEKEVFDDTLPTLNGEHPDEKKENLEGAAGGAHP